MQTTTGTSAHTSPTFKGNTFTIFPVTGLPSPQTMHGHAHGLLRAAVADLEADTVDYERLCDTLDAAQGWVRTLAISAVHGGVQ